MGEHVDVLGQAAVTNIFLLPARFLLSILGYMWSTYPKCDVTNRLNSCVAGRVSSGVKGTALLTCIELATTTMSSALRLTQKFRAALERQRPSLSTLHAKTTLWLMRHCTCIILMFLSANITQCVYPFTI